jgi:hypothetical protein
MRLSDALKEKMLDIRLRDKLVADGRITKAQVDEFLRGLSDDSKNVTYTEKNTDHQDL